MHRHSRRLLASSCVLAALAVPASAVWARPTVMQVRPAPMVVHVATPGPAVMPTLRPIGPDSGSRVLLNQPTSQPLFGPRKGIEPVTCADFLKCR
jgi:hypothetical protein